MIQYSAIRARKAIKKIRHNFNVRLNDSELAPVVYQSKNSKGYATVGSRKSIFKYGFKHIQTTLLHNTWVFCIANHRVSHFAMNGFRTT